MVLPARLRGTQPDAVQDGCTKPLHFDLNRFACAAAIFFLTTSSALAASTFGYASVFDISCGSTPVAQLVPVQANRTVLVDLTTPQRFRFATFAFHGTKDNMLANWSAIAEQIRRQGLMQGCTAGGLTYRENTRAYDVIENTLTEMRPRDVSTVVDRTRAENIFRFGHTEIAFFESRQQAFLIEAPTAIRCDASFASRCVIGAVVFLLNMGHLTTSTAEQPHLYAWEGTDYALSKELAYVTRENVLSDAVQARLRGELGVNLPLPKAIAASPLSPSPAAYATADTYDPGSDRSIQLIIEPKLFPSPGGQCGDFKTHNQMQDCFAHGGAILLASPGAKQYDADFAEGHVMGAVVYQSFGPRVAFIVRWDSILEEYVDVGYSDATWESRICRECLWSPQIQANIRRFIDPNFTARAEPNLVAYTTPELKYHLTHEEAAAILARYPSACEGLFTDLRAQSLFDEGFNPYLAGFFCDSSEMRRVWKWVPEEAASYEIAGVIPIGTDERHMAALLRHALGFRPTARLDLVAGIVDKAGIAAQAAQAAATEKAHQEERAALVQRIKRNAVLYGGGAAAVIAPIAVLVLVGRIARANARRRRMQPVDQELEVARERDITIADLLALAEKKVRAAEAQSRDARAFREQVLKRAKELLREVNLDQ